MGSARTRWRWRTTPRTPAHTTPIGRGEPLRAHLYQPAHRPGGIWRKQTVTEHNSTERTADAATHGLHLLLWSAATRTTFTVCRPDRSVAWHAPFHGHVAIDCDQDAAEYAALQAISLAARAHKEFGAQRATLRLITAEQCPNIPVLDHAASSSGLVLDLVLDAVGHPALTHPEGHWVDWWERDLDTLIRYSRRAE